MACCLNSGAVRTLSRAHNIRRAPLRYPAFARAALCCLPLTRRRSRCALAASTSLRSTRLPSKAPPASARSATPPVCFPAYFVRAHPSGMLPRTAGDGLGRYACGAPRLDAVVHNLNNSLYDTSVKQTISEPNATAGVRGDYGDINGIISIPGGQYGGNREDDSRGAETFPTPTLTAVCARVQEPTAHLPHTGRRRSRHGLGDEPFYTRFGSWLEGGTVARGQMSIGGSATICLAGLYGELVRVRSHTTYRTSPTR